MSEPERVTFRLTTGKEIFVGYRETTRQKRDRRRDAIVAAECEKFGGVIESKHETAAKMWKTMTGKELKPAAQPKHNKWCTCDFCRPF